MELKHKGPSRLTAMPHRAPAAASCRELPLPRHPRIADFDVGDRVRAHLVGVAFKYREIRFLALFKRAEAVALPNLTCGVDGYGADCVVFPDPTEVAA